ncbi:hypothetical protein K469DRAFT_698783 [Zopfia rhizophila CBS 207.26]|uniref:Uncharacterized protein n=1 Tax=Zopfia rhizophila CBS 207.26 TaxID=1314779 RepID=A0A6A6ESU2_9PEZI|nr:hypothetical protein K469DRAFT_698783 [Zopfia rhizophila CBS 207.26]
MKRRLNLPFHEIARVLGSRVFGLKTFEVDLERVLQRLEQLAQDEWKADKSVDVREYYVRRLMVALGGQKRLFSVEIQESKK